MAACAANSLCGSLCGNLCGHMFSEYPVCMVFEHGFLRSVSLDIPCQDVPASPMTDTRGWDKPDFVTQWEMHPDVDFEVSLTLSDHFCFLIVTA